MTAILKFTAVVSLAHITEAPYDLPSVGMKLKCKESKMSLGIAPYYLSHLQSMIQRIKFGYKHNLLLMSARFSNSPNVIRGLLIILIRL